MKKGFTLIELLIVAAIISILAAIAIPNFLEAQTRSKVARAKSDMRTIAGALEAYATDNNSYPRWYEPSGSFVLPGCKCKPVSRRLISLTTPVAFLTAIPSPDPFQPKEDWDGRNGDKIYDTYDYVDAQSFVDHNGAADADFGSRIYGRQWRLCSSGPDRIQTYGGSDFSENPTQVINWGFYDPSNGTVSFGDIVRLGPKGSYFSEYDINL